jgi:hypothetical protein
MATAVASWAAAGMPSLDEVEVAVSLHPIPIVKTNPKNK